MIFLHIFFADDSFLHTKQIRRKPSFLVLPFFPELCKYTMIFSLAVVAWIKCILTILQSSVLAGEFSLPLLVKKRGMGYFFPELLSCNPVICIKFFGLEAVWGL